MCLSNRKVCWSFSVAIFPFIVIYSVVMKLYYIFLVNFCTCILIRFSLSLSLQWRNYLLLKCLYFIACGEVKALPLIGAVTSSSALKYLPKYNTVPVFCTDPFFFCWIKNESPVWTHWPHITWWHVYFAWMIPFYKGCVLSIIICFSNIYIYIKF